MSPSSRFLLAKSIAFILFTLCSAAGAAAQRCSLKSCELRDAPDLFGFRLGMTFDQVQAREPQVRFGRATEIGVVKTSINPLYDPRFDKVKFAGVRTISFDFLDGKLASLWIGYEDSFKWQTIDDFVAGISKSLNVGGPWLPKRGGQELQCDGLRIFVSLIAGSPSIHFIDEVASETVARRREEAAAAAEARVTGDRTTKLYYPADCESAENVAVLNRIVFKDKDEAEKAGYKLAKDCQ